MVLKNKDGTPYRLASPNPIMKTQTLWGGEKFILHNMKWSGEKYQDTIQKSEETKKETFIEELVQSKIIETPVQIQKIEQQPIKIYETKVEVHEDKQKIEEEKKPDLQKVFIHLLPAIIKTKSDDLYGDVIRTIHYGTPTSFEAVELDQKDFYFKIWTDIDIGIESILYPKTNFKRWWRVKEKEKKANGWIITSMPSDYQPSFEKS